jgi:hypothetical protein
MFLAVVAAQVGAADRTPDGFTILPSEITLSDSRAGHGLIVEARAGALMVGDVTTSARFRSANESVAKVDETGRVTAVGDGKTTVIAVVDGNETSVPVTVRNTSAESARSYRHHVNPVLTKFGCNSGACHGAAAGKKGFKLSLRGWDLPTDYDTIVRGAAGRRIVRSDPANSLLLTKPTAELSHGGGERFTQDSLEYAILREWIAGGMARPVDDDPRVDRIEVFPKLVSLRPGDKQQVLVQAHLTDGTIQDVTRWAKFNTSSDGVAEVTEDGLVTVINAGEAAIGVWYTSQITSARISVPYDFTVDPEVFAASPRNNFIDEHVLAKLAVLNIPPSGQADDRTFVRRVYLDALGMLPTPEEVDAFLQDDADDKRSALIDRLLRRGEFTDYLAYKLGDLLLVSSKKLPQRSALLSFHRFIRESVAANKPWDRFAREIITARGSNLDNGAVNYFLIHKETTDLNETTSQAFLGLSITCARCHNHPLEKWTLDDYYGMANLLTRIKLKNGARAGEVFVQSTSFGDINHPRKGTAMAPRPLDGEPLALDASRDRRVHLADWLTAPDNPYFARAIINRIWSHYLGRGLADPEDDLRLSNPLSNEALMNALVDDFVNHKFDLRHLIRRILNSAAYQRSSEMNAGNEKDNTYHSRYLVRRLPAEVILDIYSSVTDRPTNFSGYPSGWRATQLPDSRVASYFLTAFGRPERTTTCACERQEEPSVAQTLHIANGDTLNGKLRADGGRVARLAASGATDAEILDALYPAALARPPTEAERTAASNLLATLGDTDEAKKHRREAVEDLFWAVLTSKEFLFNH